MRKLVFALAAGVALTAGPALAADLAVRPVAKAPAYVPAPMAYNWTGFYIGVHGGGDWMNKDWFVPLTPTNVAGGCPIGGCGVTAGEHSGSSWLFGAQAGFNYQVGMFVWGIEGQWSWTDLDARHTSTAPGFGAAGIVHRTETDWTATLAGRLGLTTGPALFYVKGGGAWAGDRFSTQLLAAPGVTQQAVTDTRSGWMLGVGLEYAFAPNWSAKVEYDYLDFGRRRETLNPVAAGVLPYDYDIRQNISIVKAGINYRFGFGGPVAASY